MKWGINKDFAKLAAILAAVAVVSFGMERILAYVFYGKDSFYWGRYLGIFVVLELAACLVCFREIVARKAEVAALVVTLSVGTLYALAVPASTGISWDDEWHYNCSMAMSHLLNPDVSKAEYYYADKDCFLETALEHKNYDRESQKETYQKIEKLYQQKEKTLPGRYWPRYRNLCYMPAGFGLWLGRLLSLPYHVAFMVGRWFSMLFYSILVFLAIRKLKSGKILAAAVALIPFNIFMASSYSYDHWITAWLLYGICCLFGELQQPEKKMSVFEWIFMLLAFLIGVGPKMLYIPLVLLALFLPKEKFVSPVQRKLMIAAAVCVVAAVGAKVALMFAAPGSIQDVRGGTGVDSLGQVSYIFSHPWEYTKTLLGFLWDYLSLKSANHYFSHLQYLTNLQPTVFSPLMVATLAAVAFTDKNEYDSKVALAPRIAVYVLSFGILCLVATSMYVAITAVGSNKIEGCQYRYIAPLMFPVLYSLGNGKILDRLREKIKFRGKREYYNGAVLAVCAFISIHAVWAYAINLY